MEKHILHADEIVSVLERADARLKHRKCDFFVKKMKFIGHAVVRQGKFEADAAPTAVME